MASSINQVVSSETSIGGGIYAPPRRPATTAEDNAPPSGSPIVRRLIRPPVEVEVFLIAIREPYRSVLNRLMVLLAPFQEQLMKAAFKIQVETSPTGYQRRRRKPWMIPSFLGKGLLRALIR